VLVPLLLVPLLLVPLLLLPLLPLLLVPLLLLSVSAVPPVLPGLHPRPPAHRLRPASLLSPVSPALA
jgi:hypothetical protein